MPSAYLFSHLGEVSTKLYCKKMCRFNDVVNHILYHTICQFIKCIFEHKYEINVIYNEFVYFFLKLGCLLF